MPFARFLTATLFLLPVFFGWTQPGTVSLEVNEKETAFGDSTYYAYHITVAESKPSDVSRLLGDELKGAGGSSERFKGNATMHTEVRLPKVHEKGLTTLHQVDQQRKSDQVDVAFAFLIDGLYAINPSDYPGQHEEARKAMRDLAVKLNRASFQEKLDEAEKELEKLEKDLEKAQNDQLGLEEDIAKAQEDLEKAKKEEGKLDQDQLKIEYEIKKYDALRSPSAKDIKKKSKAQKDLEKLTKDRDKITKDLFKAESDKQEAEMALPNAESEVQRAAEAVKAQQEVVNELKAQLESIQ